MVIKFNKVHRCLALEFRIFVEKKRLISTRIKEMQ